MSKFFPNTVARIAKNRGFVIIEILFALVIVGILVAIGWPVVTAPNQAEIKLQAEKNMKIYASRLFPGTSEDTRIICTVGTWRGGVMRCVASIKTSEERYQLLEADCGMDECTPRSR